VSVDYCQRCLSGGRTKSSAMFPLLEQRGVLIVTVKRGGLINEYSQAA
jgi:hypothetical protein